MDQDKIGAFLREIRKEKGLTQEQLAQQLGVSQRSVSRWETGRTMPDYSLLPSICQALDVNAAELLSGARIAGDSIPKAQVTDLAGKLIALTNDRKRVGRLACALLSALIMLFCMVGLYNREFSVRADSTADLEQAINEYHVLQEVSADILEWRAMGSRLYVLYGEKEYPGACGLACLEKGLFGHYRILSCDDTQTRWVNVRKITVGKTDYCVTYCVNDLPGIDSYGVCGVYERGDRNQSVEEAQVLFRLEDTHAPFLTFTELEKGVTLSPFRVQYYRDDLPLADEELEAVLGPHFVEDAPNSGGGTAELGLFYALESIVLLVGIVFLRAFLADADRPKGRT